MTWRVRPFRESDYSALARLRRTAERELVTPNDLRTADAGWDHARYEKVRVVAVDEEDAAVGYGEIHHEPTRFAPRRYFVRLAVEPGRRRQGIGTAIWSQLHAELEERSALVACLWTDDGTAGREFIVHRGFVEVIRAYEQVVALAAAPLPTPAMEELVASKGIRIATLSELRGSDGDDALRIAHELHTACRLDQPTLGRVTAAPLADWRAYNVDAPEALTNAYFVALADHAYVGNCSVRRRSDDTLRIGITGVLPEYRRRGIGRVLKLRVHAWGRANGFREIHTSTAGRNAPMLALNASLGYATVASWGGYELGFTR